MSKTSIALLIMFFITLTTLIVLNTTYSPNPVLKSFPKIFPTPQELASENTLSITPNPLSVQSGKAATLQITIDSQGPKPSLIQLELSYDPEVIGNVTITPGTFYQNPDVRLKTINARNGRISYAIAPSLGQEDATASNIVATIRITPRFPLTKNVTNLYFMPKTIVQTKTSKNALNAAYGTKILFSTHDEPVASPSATAASELPQQLPTAF